MISACSHAPKKQLTFYASPETEVTLLRAEESRDFRAIELLFQHENYETALGKIYSYEKKYEPIKNKIIEKFAQIYNLKGLIFFIFKKHLLAIEAFKKSLNSEVHINFQTYVLFNLASAELEARLIEDAKKTFSQIRPEILDANTRIKYLQLKAKLEKPPEKSPDKPDDLQKQVTTTKAIPIPFEPAPVNPKAVGVLLPLRSKFSKFAEQSLLGIELAFHIFDPKPMDNPITLIIENSGETIDDAVIALDKLYFQHNVIAVIGPLLSKGIEKITQRAEELALPLFSLSQQHGIEGGFIFYFALSPNTQAQAIAEYAIQKKELKKFAILFPKDKFGEQYSEAFWDSVERLGGEITGIEAYPPQETDFRQYIDKLSGLYYQEARTKELEELAHTREELQIKKKTRKTEKYYQLKPLIDYDAVFIPDEPKNIGQILPTFAYRDVEGVKFLGISTWNSRDLVTRAMPYAEGASFVDLFYPQNQNFTFQSFIETFKGTYSAEPSSLEAIAYDTASLLEKFINKYNITTRIGIAEKTKNISNYQGATGLLTFQDAQIKRKPMILTIQKGQIIEVQAEN